MRCLLFPRCIVPLLDHFHPPLSVSHPWKGFHSAWANTITHHLNEVLPEGYYAIPEVPLGDQIEIDVATLEQAGGARAGATTAVWAPPRPRLSAVVDFARVQGVARNSALPSNWSVPPTRTDRAAVSASPPSASAIWSVMLASLLLIPSRAGRPACMQRSPKPWKLTASPGTRRRTSTLSPTAASLSAGNRAWRLGLAA